jgi:DinB superfamily
MTDAEPTAMPTLVDRNAIRVELEATRSRYHELLGSLSEEDWGKKSGNPSWNVRQLMWHLGRGMEFFSETVDQCRKGKAPNPPGFLIDIGNTLMTRFGSRGATKESVGAKYDEAHEKLLAELDGVRDDEWQKGVTAYGRQHTIESVFRSVTEHFQEHEADIKKGLERVVSE